MKKIFFCLGLLLYVSSHCVSLTAADIPPVAKNSQDIAWIIKNLKIEREQLQMRQKILQDSTLHKLTQDWLGYTRAQRELTEIEKQIQEIDAEIEELEKQK